MAWRIRLRLRRSAASPKSHGCGQYGNWHLSVCLQTQRQCLARRTRAWVGVIDLCVLKSTPLPSPKIPTPELFPPGLPGRWEAGGSFLGARHLWTEDMAGLGSPAFQQLPKYVDSSVDSRSRHVPRARTKENMECFLDDTAFIQSHAFLWEGGEEGSCCLQGRGLCCGTHSPVCRHESLGCAHSQGSLRWMHHGMAVPWARSCVPTHVGSQQALALCTQRMPWFFCFLPWALSLYLPFS